ncbi:MAG: dihydrofolate reductase, partial [Oscillospiraceae bacterium]|nr:dihydrofolate reductase [Oscillospiraceae bacterium]
MITAIAAVSENWGIGKDNDLLFNIPEDKKFFRRTTLNNTVIMGRKTLQSLPNGKPFKDRRNIILSRDKNFTCDGAEVCGSVEEALKLIKETEKVFIAGGGEIYRDMLPYCDKVIIT